MKNKNSKLETIIKYVYNDVVGVKCNRMISSFQYINHIKIRSYNSFELRGEGMILMMESNHINKRLWFDTLLLRSYFKSIA